MKRIIIVICMLFTTLGYAQNILRVSNMPGVNVPYTNLAAAIAAAGPTDIIMVEGSLTQYADVTITKKVNIVGPGYFLTEYPGLQASPYSATFGTITLNAGSAGSSFSGLAFNFGYNFRLSNVSDISITNCYFLGCPFSGGAGGIEIAGTGANLLIKGNYFSPACEGININSGAYTGVIIANNYLRYVILGGSTLATVYNNIFSTTSDLRNATISNNIFLGAITSTSNSTLKNNIFSTASQGGADGTNAFNVTAANLFVGLTGFTTDTQYKLKTGSPAIGFGIGGVDCGIYGGATPYSPAGIGPGVTTINNLTVPGTVVQNGTLSVKVSAKVN